MNIGSNQLLPPGGGCSGGYSEGGFHGGENKYNVNVYYNLDMKKKGLTMKMYMPNPLNAIQVANITLSQIFLNSLSNIGNSIANTIFNITLYILQTICHRYNNQA